VLLLYDFNRNGSGATDFNTTPKCQIEFSRSCCLVEVALFHAVGRMTRLVVTIRSENALGRYELK